MSQLIIIRGVPGCGKSTFAKLIGNGSGSAYIEADMYFIKDGKYNFDITKLEDAHRWCRNKVEYYMTKGSHVNEQLQTIVVSNTSTTQNELKPYFELAEKYGYQVHVLVKENYHGGKDIHNVPEENLVKMEKRLRDSIKLR
jgi:predicted kinase